MILLDIPFLTIIISSSCLSCFHDPYILSMKYTWICKQGTVLKGVNVFAGKSDPIAKPDSDYPDWLWTILDRKDEHGWPLEKQLDARFIRLGNRKRIKDVAVKLRK
jgi:hypothetical protein